jgi:hypothetical protein
VHLDGVNGSKVVRISKSQMKKMLTILFDINSIFHFEFIPQGQTVTQAYCVNIFKLLPEAVHRKMPELWPNDWILQNDSSVAHKALFVKKFLAKKSIIELENQSCSSNLVPNEM